MPEDAWSPRRRDGRIAAALASLKADREAAEAEDARAEAYRERQQAGERTGRSPASAAVELAEENLARVRAARAASSLRWKSGTRPGSPAAAARPGSMTTAGSPAQAKVEAAKARAAEAGRKAAEREANRKRPARSATPPTRTPG